MNQKELQKRLSQAMPEVPQMVDASLVAGFDEKLHEEALDVMESIHVRVKR